MKKILVIVLCIIPFNNVLLFSQKDNTTYTIEGYLVYSYSKSKTDFFYKQDLIKEMAKIKNDSITTYDFMENRYIKYFIPIQIGDYKADTSIVIKNIHGNSISDTSFIFIDDYSTNKLYSKYENSENMLKDKLKLSVAYTLAPYYEFGDRLKKIIYVKGLCKYYSKESDDGDVKAHLTFIDRDCSAFYLITQIDSYSTIIDFTTFKVWYPYLDE